LSLDDALIRGADEDGKNKNKNLKSHFVHLDANLFPQLDRFRAEEQNKNWPGSNSSHDPLRAPPDYVTRWKYCLPQDINGTSTRARL